MILGCFSSDVSTDDLAARLPTLRSPVLSEKWGELTDSTFSTNNLTGFQCCYLIEEVLLLIHLYQQVFCVLDIFSDRLL